MVLLGKKAFSFLSYNADFCSNSLSCQDFFFIIQSRRIVERFGVSVCFAVRCGISRCNMSICRRVVHMRSFLQSLILICIKFAIKLIFVIVT